MVVACAASCAFGVVQLDFAEDEIAAAAQDFCGDEHVAGFHRRA